MLKHEREAARQGYSLTIGIDEAGRGPLAGPVVAAAVSLRDYQFQNEINDSKQLTEKKREEAFLEIFEKGLVGIGIINEKVIDEHNILNATYLAMAAAVRHLIIKATVLDLTNPPTAANTFLLIDGPHFKTDLPYRYKAIVDGDQLSLSIACASIVAKVTRDRILKVYDKVFPQYGFSQHKGYSTPEHRQAIARHGPCPIHRSSFSHL